MFATSVSSMLTKIADSEFITFIHFESLSCIMLIQLE